MGSLTLLPVLMCSWTVSDQTLDGGKPGNAASVAFSGFRLGDN